MGMKMHGPRRTRKTRLRRMTLLSPNPDPTQAVSICGVGWKAAVRFSSPELGWEMKGDRAGLWSQCLYLAWPGSDHRGKQKFGEVDSLAQDPQRPAWSGLASPPGETAATATQ